MQPRRRRRHGARPGGEKRLVIAPVPGVAPGRALDIRRQRHDAVGFERRHQFLIGEGEAERHLAALATGHDFRRQIGGEGYTVPRLEPAGRPRQRPPAAPAPVLDQGRFDKAAGRLPAALEARRDDPGVVEDHDVAGPEQPRQIGDAQVPAFPADGQQACLVPGRRRSLGDETGRQVEIEVGNPHDDLTSPRRHPGPAWVAPGDARPGWMPSQPPNKSLSRAFSATAIWARAAFSAAFGSPLLMASAMEACSRRAAPARPGTS